MTPIHKFSLRSVALAALTGFTVAASAAPLSTATYDMARDQLSAGYKVERESCNSLTANAKDICVETAKGREKVAMAHLQHQRTGNTKDMAKLTEARFEARYELAKEVCDDQTGNAKDVCVAQAKGAHEKAKADWKMNKTVTKAREDAAESKMGADFKVASERCATLTGNQNESCMVSARARYNQ